MKSKNSKILLITTAVLVMFLCTSVDAVGGGQKTLNWVKNLLINRIDKAIEQIETMKSGVDLRGEFSAEEKREIKSNLESYINYLEDKKAEVNAAETRVDLRFIVVDLRYKWRELGEYKRSIRGFILVSRFENVAIRAENLSARIDARISELNVSEEDKEGLRELRSEFDAEIDLMQDKVSDAEEKFGEGDTSEGYHLLGEARDYLYNAFNILKDIVKEFRRLQE